ncbi:hypothetical protein DFQ27_003517 [Actinomortierella ambigua]|uniref:MMS19 nucleotide excision repair protein n=1 Tax=Actinomortierella ambigua TaxID=1343610 RepID=A0A9P6U5D9_9FUNG|nr:hypothetical protein DFQ27_003517 [Actinomortierella ambigua]
MDRLISTFILSQTDSQEQADAAINDIVNDVGTSPMKLLLLVQGLGEYLTSEEAFVRSKATALLSTTLATLDQSKVNANAVGVLVDFYCDRLTDQACVPELLKGLLALSKYDKFTGDDCIKACKAVLALVNVQTYQQTARHTVFLFFDQAIRQYLKSMQTLGSEFVFGFIQCLDGEKDPRNLMLAFTLIKEIIQNFDIAQHVEDLFEVTFCYFPITFRPPPDDPYGITADHLKVGLRECLAATPYFAKFALPLLLEKLSSSSGSAKKDSMETIAACAPVYGSSALEPYSEELWNGLRNEIFHATNDDLEQIALNTLQVIATELSVGVSMGSNSDPIEKFLRPILSDCMAQLEKPELKLAKPSGRILKSCAMASDPACTAVTSATIPTLLSQYTSSDQSTRKKALLDVLLDFLDASRTLYGTAGPKETERDNDFITPLLTFKDRFFEIFTNAVLSSNEYNALRLAGIKGLHAMILLREFLSETEISYAVQYFVRIVLEDPDIEMQNEALKSLTSLANIMPSTVGAMALPELFEQLPDTPSEMEIDTVIPRRTPQYILNAVTKIALEPSLFAAVVPQVLEKLGKLARSGSNGNGDGDDGVVDPAYPIALLTSLLDLLRAKAELKHEDLPKYLDYLVPHLLGMCIFPTVTERDGPNVMKSHGILEVVGGITRVIMIHVDTAVQKTFVQAIFNIFVMGNLSVMANYDQNREKVPFTPLSATARESQQNTATLLATVITGCRQETALPVDDLEALTEALVNVAVTTPNAYQRQALSEIVATIVNKYNKGNCLNNFLTTKLIPRLQQTIQDESAVYEAREAALTTYSWLAKALVLSVNSIGYEMAGEMMKLFNVPRMGRVAADGFRIVIGEQADILTKETFAVRRLLYKQRFFNYCTPVLVQGFVGSSSSSSPGPSSSSNEVRHHFLVALSHVLRNIPKPILLTELPPLLPLLVHSLSFPDPELKASTIGTFQSVTKEAKELIAEHLGTLVPLLLQLTLPTGAAATSTPPASGTATPTTVGSTPTLMTGITATTTTSGAGATLNTMKVRVAALQCLGELAKDLPFTALVPYKQQVLKDLERVLDDKKRFVRREAVECRSLWFALSGNVSA